MITPLPASLIDQLTLAHAADLDRQLHERGDGDLSSRDQWALEVLELLREAPMFRFPVTQMSDGDIEAELESLAHYYQACEEIGQGISTKDVVRRRDLEREQERRLNAINCARGFHSWIDTVGRLPASHKCAHCGESYGDAA